MAIALTDLISVSTLQSIQDGFARLTGMAALTTDAEGNAVTRGSNFTEFCMDLTRKSREGCRRCGQCDKKGGEDALLSRKSVAYSCHAGLVDFAAPIMLGGEMIGSFIGGQVLTEAPDEEKFRAIARELSIDEDKYIAALRKVKIVERSQVEAAADFCSSSQDFFRSRLMTLTSQSRTARDLQTLTRRSIKRSMKQARLSDTPKSL